MIINSKKQSIRKKTKTKNKINSNNLFVSLVYFM